MFHDVAEIHCKNLLTERFEHYSLTLNYMTSNHHGGQMKPLSNETSRALNTYTKLMRAAESVTSRVHRVLTEPKLTISQFGVLEALYHKGPLCQRDIAVKILKSTGNITLVIDNLEKQGLVRRVRDNEDRRYLTVHLTETGTTLIAKVFADVEAAIVTEMASLTENELESLGALCKKLGLKGVKN
jgi:MarR family 2-MHQ and catechol resistance regulon transcriptional repressor